ncbi:MAG TPA: glycoside hydrolase family 57 protein [Steroidobacteraceae bacterium]|nr:glycoside hydrolase family 57 protein [Steroidobacteraceae bacterium]
MPAATRLPVVLLWHMHQPQYRDAFNARYALPWTYLHAIKDYTDMAAHLEDNVEARAVVNFSPVLLEQLEDIATRTAAHLEKGAPLPDPVLSLLGPDALPKEPAPRLALLKACLRAQRKQMIERFGPYLELATIAETLATPERVAYASDQFIHDLAVWYHLAWLGETVRRADPLVAQLTERGRDFSAAQRRALLTLIGKLVGGIVPRYRALAERGQCELSVTPYAHPIIPLLLDFGCARMAVPDIPLPVHPGYPGGAARSEWHVEEAIAVFSRAFGTRPAGCWPAEGAVSEATLKLLAANGFRWAASGGAVLRNSLAFADPRAAEDAASYNRPYRAQGVGLNCFFRDDNLSDLIGFTYATWHGDDAAQNLANELTQLARRYQGDPGHAVLIALDGENAWEHYPFNGYYFLKALYSVLAEHPQLELMTLSGCLARGLQPAPLARVVAGSWVHGTLATWMGDADKNRAWDLLCDAKEACDRVLATDKLEAAQRAGIGRQLALCESSDWFWWFGDYNPAESVSQFDELYRHQLVTLYRHLGLNPPDSLALPISTGHGSPEHGGAMRRASAS